MDYLLRDVTNSTTIKTYNVSSHYRYKDDELIVADWKHRMTYNDGVASLFLDNLHADDAGEYTCVGTNDLGEVKTQGHLDVEGENSKMGQQFCFCLFFAFCRFPIS